MCAPAGLFAPQANAIQGAATPEYASPEQADTTTGEVDETFDLYSLLAIRYELLIGAVLFDPATLRNVGLAEMLRISRARATRTVTSSGSTLPALRRKAFIEDLARPSGLRGPVERCAFLRLASIRRSETMRVPSKKRFVTRAARKSGAKST